MGNPIACRPELPPRPLAADGVQQRYGNVRMGIGKCSLEEDGGSADGYFPVGKTACYKSCYHLTPIRAQTDSTRDAPKN
jgi:hypothetical protein